MFEPSNFWFFIAGALLLNITPGPDMAFTMATSARGGVRPGVAAAIGVGAGSLGWSVLTAAGLAALLAASDHAMTIIRVAGGCYLLFLAVRTLTSPDGLPEARGAISALHAFRSGALTNLFNPKVGIFFLAFLPGFTSADAGPIWLQTFLLGAIFSVTGAMVLIGVAFLAGALRNRLAESHRFRTGLNVVAATVFGGLGLRLLLARDL